MSEPPRLLFPLPVNLPPNLGRLSSAETALALPPTLRTRKYDLSVVIPAYNVEPYIERCIRSVDANRNVAIQIIIVNDGSCDQTLDVAIGCVRDGLRHDALVVTRANAGVSAARNFGLALSTGDYVAYLDSDDFMEAGSYDEMVRQARVHDADIVLCRSRLLDDQTLGTNAFYDATIFDQALQGHKVRVTDALETPALLGLEPNANTRITRRALIDSAALTYPEGLQFEDLAVHTVGLLAARRIALIDQRFYYYLINRSGKITYGRTRTRFDIIEVGRETIERAQEFTVTPAQGRYIVLGLLRLVVWCGSHVPLADREEFFRRACDLFATIPSAWIRYSWRHPHDRRRDRTLIRALRNGHWRYLRSTSCGQKTPLTNILFRVLAELPVT
jgi:glycosyltransferase involved in cell wall biosynthesis